MFSTRQRIAVRSQDQRKKVISSVQSGSNFSSGANVSVSSPGMSNQKDGFLSGILPSTDDAMLRGYYRDIYDFDHVSGAAVDLLSSLPFSDWTLVGADDNQLSVFNSAMDRLNFRSLLPELSIDYLVLGVFIATLVYKREAKQFTDIIPHNPDDIIQSVPSPIYSADPHLQLRVGKSLKDLATGQDAYNTGLRARLNDSMVASLKHSLVTLDPLTTLYLPRKTYSVSGGTSFYRRILPIFLLERLLYRGTLTEATRRQRSILHITAGDEFWEPTEEELLGLVTLFQQADLDPIGAMIATRNDVQTTELRAAGEFWRYTDIVESTTVMKLRAMGISESFLCLTGDTLVSTNAGLVRLDSFGDPLKMEKDSSIDVDFQLKGKDGRVVNACKWWYRGKNAVKKVTTYSGYNIKGTASHKILVLADGATTEWKTIQELMPNQDRLCVDLNSADKNRRKSLRLTLSDPEINAHQTNLKIPNKPKVMTPELAYVMGMIISEGSLGKYDASISNSDDAIIERYRACVNKVFGLGLGIYIPKVVIGETMSICGIDCTRNVVPKEVSVHSKVVAKWLNELGVNWTERKNEKSPCCSYAIPWSILKADDESKFSFLAAYIDGDGRVAVKPTKDGVKNVEISIYSGSYLIIQMLQILLSDLGIKSRILHEHHRLVIPPSSGGYLYSRISKYMGCERKKLQDYNATPLDVKSGIPLSCFEQLLKSRHIRREVNVGEWFENDEGKPTLVERYGQRCKISVGVNKDRSNAGLLLYDSFDDGVYDDLLCLIKQISTKLHTNLLRLFQIRYLFDPVVSVEDKGKKHLFDLTVDSNSPPAFVANGIVVHNSGEANYSTAEVALSVFIEGLRAYRLNLTRRLFTNKLFPLISVVNGFYKQDKVQASVNPYLATAAAQNQSLTQDIQFEMNDTSKLVIPEVHWHKQLKPQADRDYMELLTMLEEKGVPITLRMWAAAGGLSLDNIKDDMEEDTKLRKEIKDLKGKSGAANPNEDGGEGEEGEEEYALSSVMGRKPRSILSRDYGEQAEIIGRTKTGRPKVVNQRRENERANISIAKAMQNLSDEERMAQVLSTTSRKIRL